MCAVAVEIMIGISSSRGITQSCHWTETICIFIRQTHPYMKCELNVWNGCCDNDRKVNDDSMTERGNTSLCPGHFIAGHKTPKQHIFIIDD